MFRKIKEMTGETVMKILFWDFDGTLVHSGPLWSNNVYAALKTVDANTYDWR